MSRRLRLARLLVDGRTALEKVHRLTKRRYPLLQDLLEVSSPEHQRSFRDLVDDFEKEIKAKSD